MAIAYCGPPPAPTEIATSFNADPTAMIALAVLGVLMRRRPAGLAATAVLIVAFVSPLCALSSALFAARSAHHLLIVAVAAPLLAAALPNWRAGPAWPWLLSSGAVLALWHLPGAYDAALSSVPVYWAMQLALLGSASGLWRSLHDPRQTLPLRALIIVLAFAQMGLVGALLTLAPAPLYAAHASAPLAWGLTPLDDQRLGGLIMWVAAVVPYTVAAALFCRREWALLTRDDGALSA
ncbi:MAG TPA: cytochrome c oxidase assembly protein [Brevundimonas sp.]|nr:cytochrome c oxidase assembly protein [Brevundimonas sp.]